MSNNFLRFFSYLYTFFLKKKFYSFGENSIIKLILNSANEKYILVGKNVNIGAFCRITVSTEFSGHKVKSKNKIRIKIGNNVDIGNNSFISANNSIVIGEHVIIAPYVFITDHDHGFKDVNKHLHQQPLTEGGSVKIEDNVFLGIKSSVLKNVTIGEHSVVAAHSVVTKDVTAYTVVAGNPAKVIKKFDIKTKRWLASEKS